MPSQIVNIAIILLVSYVIASVLVQNYPEISENIGEIIGGVLPSGNITSEEETSIEELSPGEAVESAEGLTNEFSVSSEYLGNVIKISGWDYAPTIMKDTDGLYKMWWCAGASSTKYPSGGDHIRYANSTDGLDWSKPIVVLGPTPGAISNWDGLRNWTGPIDGKHTCDPSVVKVQGKYYLYYTGYINRSIGNQIFLATSNDGINWKKYPSDNNLQPVIKCNKPAGSRAYCMGQSSVIYNGTHFIHYYTNTTSGPKQWVAYSTDGINFFGYRPTFHGAFGGDVKYVKDLDIYFNIWEQDKHWQISYNGLNWTKWGKFIDSVNAHQCAFMFGVLGDTKGVMNSETIIYYGMREINPDGSCLRDPSKWDIDATRIKIYRVQPPTTTTTTTTTTSTSTTTTQGGGGGGNVQTSSSITTTSVSTTTKLTTSTELPLTTQTTTVTGEISRIVSFDIVFLSLVALLVPLLVFVVVKRI